MPYPDYVQANLEIQFNEVDKMYANDDLRVFGRDTNRIFKEIDVIRRKQIELATEHISLESIDDISSTQRNLGEEESKGNSAFFSKKEKALKSLMVKLDALGQIMNDFREASDLNPHNAIASNISRRTRTSEEEKGISSTNQNDRPVSNTQHHYSSNEDSSNANTPRASSSSHAPQTSIPVFSFDQSPSK